MKKIFGLIVSGLFLSLAALANTTMQAPPSGSNMKQGSSTDTSMDSMNTESTSTTTKVKEKKQKMEDDSGMHATDDNLSTKGSGSSSPSTEDTSGY